MRVPSNFYRAVHVLKRMKTKQRQSALAKANDKFINDLSHVMRKDCQLPPNVVHVSPQLKRRIRSRQKALQSFTKAKTSLKRKRMIVRQKGGIIPALIPIICAAIGAGGSVAAAGVGAAIAKA